MAGGFTEVANPFAREDKSYVGSERAFRLENPGQAAPAPEPETPTIFGDYAEDDQRVQILRELGRDDADAFGWAQDYYGGARDSDGNYKRLTGTQVRSAATELAKRAVRLGYMDDNTRNAYAAQEQFVQMIRAQENIRLSQVQTDPEKADLTVLEALDKIEYDAAEYQSIYESEDRVKALTSHLKEAGLPATARIRVARELARNPDADLRAMFSDNQPTIPGLDVTAPEAPSAGAAFQAPQQPEAPERAEQPAPLGDPSFAEFSPNRQARELRDQLDADTARLREMDTGDTPPDPEERRALYERVAQATQTLRAMDQGLAPEDNSDPMPTTELGPEFSDRVREETAGMTESQRNIAAPILQRRADAQAQIEALRSSGGVVDEKRVAMLQQQSNAAERLYAILQENADFPAPANRGETWARVVDGAVSTFTPFVTQLSTRNLATDEEVGAAETALGEEINTRLDAAEQLRAKLMDHRSGRSPMSEEDYIVGVETLKTLLSDAENMSVATGLAESLADERLDPEVRNARFQARAQEVFARADQLRADLSVGTVDPLRSNTLAAQLSTGVGNLAAYAATAIVATAATGSPVAGAAAVGATGSAATRQQLMREAVEAGADVDTAEVVGNLGAAVGVVEGLPIFTALRPLERLAPRIKNRVAQAIVTKVVRDGFVAEGAQEGISQIMQNLVAKGFYDEDRGWLDGVAESALVGSILGSSLAGASTGAQLSLSRTPDASTPTPPAAPVAEAPAPQPLRQPAPTSTDTVRQDLEDTRAEMDAEGRVPEVEIQGVPALESEIEHAVAQRRAERAPETPADPLQAAPVITREDVQAARDTASDALQVRDNLRTQIATMREAGEDVNTQLVELEAAEVQVVEAYTSLRATERAFDSSRNDAPPAPETVARPREGADVPDSIARVPESVVEVVSDPEAAREDGEAPLALTMLERAGRRVSAELKSVQDRKRSAQAELEQRMVAGTRGALRPFDTVIMSAQIASGVPLSDNVSDYIPDADTMTRADRQVAQSQLNRARALQQELDAAEADLTQARDSLRADYEIERQKQTGRERIDQGRDTAADRTAVAAAEAQERAQERTAGPWEQRRLIRSRAEADLASDNETRKEQARATIAALHVAEKLADGEVMSREEIATMLDAEFGISDLSRDEAPEASVTVEEIIEEAERLDDEWANDPAARQDVQDAADDAIGEVHQFRFQQGTTAEKLYGETEVADIPDAQVDPEEQATFSSTVPGARPGKVRFNPRHPVLAKAATLLERVSKKLGSQQEIILMANMDLSLMTPEEIAAEAQVPVADAAIIKRNFMEGTGSVTPAEQARSYGLSLSTAASGRPYRVIMVRPDLDPDYAAMIAAHEMGHAMQDDLMAAASDKTKNMLWRAFEEEVPATEWGDVPRRLWPVVQGAPETGRLTSEDMRYVNSFSEWFASRVGAHMYEASQPKGLGARLVQAVANIWSNIRAAITGKEVAPNAVAEFVKDAVSTGLKPQILSDGSVQYSRKLSASSDPAGRAMPVDMQQQVHAAVDERLRKSGLRLQFARTGRNGRVFERFKLARRAAAYSPPYRRGQEGTIILDPTSVGSVSDAVRQIDRVVAAEFGLSRVMTPTDYRELLVNLGDENRSTGLLRGAKQLGAGRKKLARIRRQATEMLRRVETDAAIAGADTDSLVTPSSIGKQMLVLIADEARNKHGGADLGRSLARIMTGGEGTPNMTYVLDLLGAAADVDIDANVAITAAKTRARIIQQKSLLLRTGSWIEDVFTRERGQSVVEGGFVVNRESATGKMARLLGSNTIVFRRLMRLAANEGNEALRVAAQQVEKRLKAINTHRDRIAEDQAHYGRALRDAAKKAIVALAGPGADAVITQAAINTYMVARHSIERNRANALVYGDLRDTPELEAARKDILDRSDAEVRRLQGLRDEEGADGEVFADDVDNLIEMERERMIIELGFLLDDPKTPNRVQSYIKNSSQSLELSDFGPWADFSGATILEAKQTMERIEKQFGGKMARVLEDSGLNKATREITQRAVRNRYASGIAGREGQVTATRLHYANYVPLRGTAAAEVGSEGPTMSGKPMPLNAADSAIKLADYFGASSDAAPQQARGPLRGRGKLADAADLMRVMRDDLLISSEENATNYMHRAVAELGRQLQAAGLTRGGSQNADARSIIVSDEAMPLYIPNPDGRGVIRNPALEVNGTELLAFEPDGRAYKVTVNDRTMWDAINDRFSETPPLLRPIEAVTRFRSRTVTTYDPRFTYVTGFLRDIEESTWALASDEFGLTAREVANRTAKTAKYVPVLHKFFLSSPEKQAEIMAAAAKDPNHPLHLFEKRRAAGGLQRYRDQLLESPRGDTLSVLEAVQDEDASLVPADVRRGLLSRAGDSARSASAVADGAADAMENASRQSMFDMLYAKNKRDGMRERAAVEKAMEDTNSIMDYNNRSRIGRLMQPVFMFAQVSLTSSHNFFARRIWKDGKAPLITHRNPDGTVSERLAPLPQVMSQLNMKAVGAGAIIGFVRASLMMSTGLTLKSLYNAVTGEEEEEKPDTAAQTRRVLDLLTRGNGKGLSREAKEAYDDLVKSFEVQPEPSSRSMYSLMTKFIVSSDRADQDVGLPVGYGVPMISEALGVSAALIMAGEDPGDVAKTLSRVVERNFSPLDAPYGDPGSDEGLLGGLAGRFTPAISELVRNLTGEGNDGYKTRTDLKAFGGLEDRGAAGKPTFSDSTVLTGAMREVQTFMEETTGIRPDWLTNPRYVETLLNDLGAGLGRITTDGLDVYDRYNRGEDQGLFGAALTMLNLEDRSKNSSAIGRFYDAYNDPRFDDLETWEALYPDNEDFKTRHARVLRAARSIIGLRTKSEGQFKAAQEAMMEAGDYTMTVGDFDGYSDLVAKRRQFYEDAGMALEYLLETTDFTPPAQ